VESEKERAMKERRVEGKRAMKERGAEGKRVRGWPEGRGREGKGARGQAIAKLRRE